MRVLYFTLDYIKLIDYILTFRYSTIVGRHTNKVEYRFKINLNVLPDLLILFVFFMIENYFQPITFTNQSRFYKDIYLTYWNDVLRLHQLNKVR